MVKTPDVLCSLHLYSSPSHFWRGRCCPTVGSVDYVLATIWHYLVFIMQEGPKVVLWVWCHVV